MTAAVEARNIAGTVTLMPMPTSLTCMPPRTYHGLCFSVEVVVVASITLSLFSAATDFATAPTE